MMAFDANMVLYIIEIVIGGLLVGVASTSCLSVALQPPWPRPLVWERALCSWQQDQVSPAC